MNVEALTVMLNELESHRLEVALVPLRADRRGYNEGGCKRVCVDRNPRWYSQFCNAHLSSRVRNHRKPDTKIKRQNVLRLLRRLVDGLPTTSKYAAELMRRANACAT
jgi:hypothetical protein